MNNRRSVLSSLAMILVGALCLALPSKASAAPGDPGKIDVLVVDSAGAPVAGANVELHHRKHTVAHGKTNDAGHYIFEKVRVGKHNVDAGKKDVGHGRALAEVKSGETTSVTVTLKKK